MMQRAVVRLIMMSAAAVMALAGCGSAVPPAADAGVTAASSVASAPVATTSPVSSTPTPTSTATSTPVSASSGPTSSISTPKSRADAAFEHWTAQVPVYPGAVPWEAGSRSPALGTAQVDGFFTHTTSWSTTDDVATVVKWFRSRVQLAGWAGSLQGPVQQWELVFTSTPAHNAATTAGSLSLLIGTGGRGTLVSVVAAGAPIPDRSTDTRINPDLIVSATVRVTPSSSPVPDGWEPRRPTTVTLSPTDRNQLIAVLNGLPVQPPMLSGGVAFGYLFVVTLHSSDGSVITVSSDTNHSIQGPVLDFGDSRHVQLDVGRSGYPVLLLNLCGVRLP